VDGAHERRARLGPRPVLDEPAQVVLVEALELHAPPESRQLAEDRADVLGPVRVGVVVGRDDEDRHVLDLADEEGQQQQRRQARRVHVVEEQHDRSAAGGAAQEHRHRVEEREPRLLGLEAVGRRGDPEPLADLGGDLRDPARPGPEIGRELVVAARLGDRAHDLLPGPVGRGAAPVPAARRGDERAALVGSVDERAGQARLADARLAGDEEQAAVPRDGAVERLVELCELALAAEERRLACPGWTPSCGGGGRL
jgi:hypothetical protein